MVEQQIRLETPCDFQIRSFRIPHSDSLEFVRDHSLVLLLYLLLVPANVVEGAVVCVRVAVGAAEQVAAATVDA